MPLEHAALMRAIELNGVQVENNKAAFEWGRRAAHEPRARARRWSRTGQVIELVKRSSSVDDMIAKRVEFLTAYQNAGLRRAVQGFVDRFAPRRPSSVLVHGGDSSGQAEHPAHRGRRALPVQADGLQGRVRGRAPAHRPEASSSASSSQFEGSSARTSSSTTTSRRPRIAKKNAKGELQKQKFGPVDADGVSACWRSFKGLRGTALDLFGRTEERKTERALDRRVPRDAIDEVLRSLERRRIIGLAVEIARLPEMIRGYGHVKERHLAAARPKWDALMADWRAGPLRLLAAGAGLRCRPKAPTRISRRSRWIWSRTCPPSTPERGAAVPGESAGHGARPSPRRAACLSRAAACRSAVGAREAAPYSAASREP